MEQVAGQYSTVQYSTIQYYRWLAGLDSEMVRGKDTALQTGDTLDLDLELLDARYLVHTILDRIGIPFSLKCKYKI